jgi:hypothetical protein
MSIMGSRCKGNKINEIINLTAKKNFNYKLTTSEETSLDSAAVSGVTSRRNFDISVLN